MIQMKIDILEEKKDKIIFELKDASHTICNALKNELWNDKHVKVATYAVKHPLVNVPKMIVETDGEKPRKVVADAAKRLKKTCEKFESEFSKEVK